MARLRKAARVWRNPAARTVARQALVGEDGAQVLTLDPPALFGRHAPLEVELGAGRGDFIIERAAAYPERDFLAIELAASVARLLAVRAGRRGINNLRVVRADARTIVNLLIPDRAVSAYHLYFPDPWPKLRHRKHRLMSEVMVESLTRTLVPGGRLYVASDVPSWAEEMFAMAAAGGLVRLSAEVAGARVSGFGRKYHAAGKAVFAATFERAQTFQTRL